MPEGKSTVAVAFRRRRPARPAKIAAMAGTRLHARRRHATSTAFPTLLTTEQAKDR